MTRSHSMIILCDVVNNADSIWSLHLWNNQDTVSSSLCDVQACSSHNANYDLWLGSAAHLMVGTNKPDWEGRHNHAAQLQGAAALDRGEMEALIQVYSELCWRLLVLLWGTLCAVCFTVKGSSFYKI